MDIKEIADKFIEDRIKPFGGWALDGLLVDFGKHLIAEIQRRGEPVGIVKWNTGGNIVHIVGDVKPGDVLFTFHPSIEALVTHVSLPTNTMEQWVASEIRRATSRIKEQLILAQAEIKRLRYALTEIRTFPRYRMPADIANEALAHPSDTSALDAYVAEKVKDLQADRDDCLTLAKSNFAKLMALTKQRDLAVEALEAVSTAKARGFGIEYAKGYADKALSTIKESEVK